MLTITNKKMPYTPNMGYTFNPCNAEYNKFHAYIAHYIHQSEETFIKTYMSSLNSFVLLLNEVSKTGKKKINFSYLTS
jgi:hypothetical protein